MMRTDVRRGFTLIELLVVIAVIAILASILFPVFAKATAKAKQTACLSNVRQLTTALLMFTQDNKNTYPTVDPSDLTKSWAGQLESFVGNRKIYRCPLDDNGDGYVSYVMNGMLVAYDGTGIQTSAVKDPADVGAFVDGTSYKFPESGVLNWSQDSHSGSACTYVERHSLCQSYCDGHAEPLNGPKLCDPVSFYAPLGQGIHAGPQRLC